MSARYNTQNPIESDDVRDMSDNAKNLDLFSNSSELSFADRLGVERQTIYGMNSEFNDQILNMGFSRVGTFSSGATLTNPRQTLLWDTANGGDGQEYGWSGALPKVVPPSSTPLTTGGIAVGAWMSRFDPELRIIVREAIRRSYAEAGYNLAAGSFETSGTISSANEAMLYEADGRAYSWGGTLPKTVPSGSTPGSAGGIGSSAWTSREATLLKTKVDINDYNLWASTAKRLGLTLVGTFEAGCSVTAKYQAVLLRSSGALYVRTAEDSITVPPNSTPESGWTLVVDNTSLRSSTISKTDIAYQTDVFFNRTYSPVKIVAHRGFSFIGMENTIMAFQKAHNLGADMLECDIQVTSDGVPVIFHDDTTDRLMNGTGDVLSLPYSTISAMKFKDLASTPYKNEPIPRLVDICDWISRSDAVYLAEFKRLRSLADVQLIANIVKQYNVEDNFVWQCNDTPNLIEVRKYLPNCKIAFFSDTFIPSRLTELSRLGNAIYMVQYAALNSDSTIGAQCQAAGVELATYTNNNSYTLRNLRRQGLKYIITDVNLGRLN